MKARQSSIYRNMEMLLGVLMMRFQKVPKSVAYQVVAQKSVNELLNAMDSVTLALQTKDCVERMQILNMAVVYMTSVKTTLRVMHEVSSNAEGVKVLNARQYAEIVTLIDKIAYEMGKWMSKSHKEEERP